GTDENDNGAIAYLYNLIDRYAGQLQCAFVLIHHASKGNQSGKAVTDVGAGAGSQSRAADTHLILRPHEEEGITVLESAVRSWPPMEPLGLSWEWPLFTPTAEVDTSALLGVPKPKSKPRDIPLEDFVEQCIAINDPCSKRSVRYEASQVFSLSERQANENLDLAIERGLVTRIRAGASMRYVKNRPGVSGDKALQTAALLAHDANPDIKKIAETVGVSERYVRQIRNENKGLTAELENASRN
ncbi:MAG: helicase RepA family protein, partial [Phycisphaerae bacterium]|nr:helicase RepA family protein [Phycisphaerae bacterium]